VFARKFDDASTPPTISAPKGYVPIHITGIGVGAVQVSDDFILIQRECFEKTESHKLVLSKCKYNVNFRFVEFRIIRIQRGIEDDVRCRTCRTGMDPTSYLWNTRCCSLECRGPQFEVPASEPAGCEVVAGLEVAGCGGLVIERAFSIHVRRLLFRGVSSDGDGGSLIIGKWCR
jgi:hypothetical protein